MFCDQCEQTAKGTGCTVMGVCGKNNEVAIIQDQLVHILRRLAFLTTQASSRMDVTAYDDFIADALFATLTNVNFDPAALRALQEQAFLHCRTLAAATGETPDDLEGGLDAYLAGLPETAVGLGTFSTDRNIDSAMQILLFGLKGLCAYKDHAARLDQRDASLSAFVRKALIAGSQWEQDAGRDLNGWLALLMECGEANLKAMELLDTGNTRHFGNPEPSRLSLGHRKGKAILISGHDLLDLAELLKQTEGTGINIYTHGEMLPAHGYPRLKAYRHLAGNFGTAWENQQKEFPDFPGPILMTTNCLQNPRGYADKIFTTGNVGWPGCHHCHNHDFSSVIKKAMEMDGFAEDMPDREIMTGFGRQTLHDAAPQILEAVSRGQLRHIFLVGGCDGARPTRSYYTEFVEKTPPDTLVLTLACGKFRFYDKDLGKLGNFPRLMDCGQCNDAYTAIKTAAFLAESLRCSVNDLPLSLIISWYEQKAVAILLTLLALGIRNIILGPTLPAFVSPDILKVLVEKYNIALISNPDDDLKTCLGRN